MKKTLLRTRVISLLIIVAMAVGITITVLSSGWTLVGTFEQFRAAIESPTVTQIRLTNNIHIPRNGVVINPNKAELIIDGAGFTFSAHSSNSKSDTLRYSSAGNLKDITVINATIVSHNYWGFLHVDSSSRMSDVVVTFRDINYFGPQLVYAEDSTVVIGTGNYTLLNGHNGRSDELAEATHIRLEGNVTIFKDMSGRDEVFRIERANGGLTVASGAVVNVSLNQDVRKAHKAGFIHFQRSGGYLRFEDDSYINFVGNGFFQQHRDVKEVYIGQRAQVHIRTHGDFKNNYGIFMIKDGHMVVEEDAVVNLISTENRKKDPVIMLDKKTSTVTLNNPKQFFVYNSSTRGSKGHAIGLEGSADVATVFYNDISEVAYWIDNTSPHDNLVPATYVFRNEDESSFSLNSSNTKSSVTRVGSVGYNGITPFDKKTAFLKDVNVIYISGGTGDGIVVRHTVEFNSNGGSPVDPQEIIHGERAVRPEPDPTREYMVLEGWYPDPGFNDDPWNFDDPVTEGMILYAKWDFAQRTDIQYRAGWVGEGGSSISDVGVGSMHIILSPTAAGVFSNEFTFSHWNTHEFGLGISYAPGQQIRILGPGPVILYAQWVWRDNPDSNSLADDFQQTSIQEEVADPAQEPESDIVFPEQEETADPAQEPEENDIPAPEENDDLDPAPEETIEPEPEG